MQIKLSMINWLNCIWESDLPSNSKYLAAYLRKFMNDNQDMAWPSYSRISKETGLARPTISKYLAILDSNGWLKREKGNSEKNTVYYAVFPKQIEQQIALVNGEGSKGDLLGVVNEVNYGSKGDLLGVVNEVNSNKQVNKQSNKPKDIIVEKESSFDKFWNMYDKKVGKKDKCRKKFLKLSKSDINKIFETLPQYIKSTPDKQYRKNPETYLNNESWNDEIITQPSQPKRSVNDISGMDYSNEEF